MDESFISLGKFRLLGCPYHGLVRGNRLTLPNGSNVDGQWDAMRVRGSVLLAVPGAPAVSRTTDEAAYDTTSGYQWRNDAVIHFDSNDVEGMLYGLRFTGGEALYAVGVGNCWSVKLPSSRATNGPVTELANPATLTAFGRIGYSPVAIEEEVTVTLEGYASEPTASPSGHRKMIDCLPDGSQVILGGTSFDSRFELYRTSEGGGFCLLKTSGDGSGISPFAVALELLSKPGFADASAVTDSFVTHRHLWRWEFADEDVEFFPVDGEECESQRRTLNSPTIVSEDSTSPSALSYITGTREAELTGYIVGWWFEPGGTPQPITADYRYTLTSDYSFSGVGVGDPSQVIVQPYVLYSGTCIPHSGASYTEVTGSYNWTCESVQTTTEEIEITLRVGGTEIDTHVIRYEGENKQSEVSTSGIVIIPGGITGPVGTTATNSVKQVLKLDGVEIDRVETSASSGAPFQLFNSSPVRRIDTTNRFVSGGLTYQWLPVLAHGDHKLGSGYGKIWGCKLHWWSNRLICLREEFTDGPDFKIIDRYGFTAYPGGVTGSRIDATVLLPSGHAAPLYGALNPFGGAPLLGQTDKITYI